MWGIHNDQSAIDPIADGAVRIGWDVFGDLSQIEATRDAFKAAVGDHMPQTRRGQDPHECRHALPVRSRDEESATWWFVRTGRPARSISAACQRALRVPPRQSTSTSSGGRVRLGAHRCAPHELSYRSPGRDQLCDDALQASHGRGRDRTPPGEHSSTRGRSRTTRGPTSTLVWSTPSSRIRNDRATLLEKMWAVSTASGRPVSCSSTFGPTSMSMERQGPIRDIDPFTILGSFNRGIRNDARAVIARAYGEEFGVDAALSHTFPGVPVVNNMKSWFFHSRMNARQMHESTRCGTSCAAAVALRRRAQTRRPVSDWSQRSTVPRAGDTRTSHDGDLLDHGPRTSPPTTRRTPRS